MSTLKDISLKSGFSVSAVSRVLSGDKTFSINQDNKNKIIATAKELNYVNKAKSTNDFKIAIINWYSQDQELVDPYYYYIRKGVEKQCQEDKINYKLFFKEDDLTNLNNFDSIIAIGKFGNMTLKQLSLYNKHLVFVDSNIDNNLYDSIQVDFSILMKEIFDYLIEINEKSIGLLMGQEFVENKQVIDMRIVEYKKQCKLNNLDCEKNIIEGEFTLESGFNMFNELHQLNKVPKVLICGNDFIAMGANKAAYIHGYDVGNDLKIIGINDIPVSEYMVPSLTTVSIPQSEMGREAVLLVKKHKNEKSSYPITISLPTKLIKRKSC